MAFRMTGGLTYCSSLYLVVRICRLFIMHLFKFSLFTYRMIFRLCLLESNDLLLNFLCFTHQSTLRELQDQDLARKGRRLLATTSEMSERASHLVGLLFVMLHTCMNVYTCFGLWTLSIPCIYIYTLSLLWTIPKYVYICDMKDHGFHSEFPDLNLVFRLLNIFRCNECVRVLLN